MVKNFMLRQLNLKPNNKVKKESDWQISEWAKCRKYPLYFILNYCYLEETGNKVKYAEELMHKKLRRVVNATVGYHSCIFMASRQLGKSSISACLLAWAMIFYPRIYIIILNFEKKAGYGNLNKIKFIMHNLPEWMKVPLSSRSELKTSIDLQNGSRCQIYYPSTTTRPESLARSLSAPILYVDESAFIPWMEKIYGSAQQTLATARTQAIKNQYPFFTLVTSTP